MTKQVIITHVVNARIRVCTKNGENIDQAAIDSSEGIQEDFTKKGDIRARSQARE